MYRYIVAERPESREESVFLRIKAVSFFGNDIEGVDYRDSEDINGTIPEMFTKCMALRRFLR